MRLPGDWASPGDFATLFQYLWHRDFPIDSRATGARRADWTIHIGVVVRAIADLMGLFPRFEHGGRKDAILRSTEGDEVAVEWEWTGVWGNNNEVEKLKHHKVWRPKHVEDRSLAYSVLITYTHEANLLRVQENVSGRWDGADWPLLLILIVVEENKRFSSGKDFKRMHSVLFKESGKVEALRESPATPWRVSGSRWSEERMS